MSEYIVRETGYPGTLKQEIVGELVRCKDCKYYDSHHPYPVCNYHEDNVKETDYCSWGERKDKTDK